MLLDKYDVSKASNEGRQLVLRDLRTGEPLPCSITLLGEDSDKFRAVEREMLVRRTEAASAGTLRTSVDQEDAEAVDMLAAVTTGWKNIGFDGQENVAFSLESVRKFYTRFRGFRVQAIAFMRGRGNFMSDAPNS